MQDAADACKTQDLCSTAEMAGLGLDSVMILHCMRILTLQSSVITQGRALDGADELSFEQSRRLAAMGMVQIQL